MLKNKALFPGTFDPFTIGHLEVVKQALSDYDYLHVVIMINKTKKPHFTIQKRLAIIKNTLEKDVIINYWAGSAVDYCKNNKINTIIRGYRNDDDLKYENQLFNMYKKDNPKLETKLYKTKTNVSSSEIREHLNTIDEYKKELLNERLIWKKED